MKVLRSKSGVSLMYVLATMMLLMAVGVSAITAAGMNAGAAAVQRDRTQLEMYSSSFERTIRTALEEQEEPNISLSTIDNNVSFLTDVETLGGHIIFEAIALSEIFPVQPVVPDPEDDPETPIEIGSIRLDNFPPIIRNGITVDIIDDDTLTYNIQITAGDVTGTLKITVAPYERYKEIEYFAGYETDPDTGEIIAEIMETEYVYATQMVMTVSGEITIRQRTLYTPAGAGRLGLGAGTQLEMSTSVTYRLANDVILLELTNVFSSDIDFPDDSDKWLEPKFEEMVIVSPIEWTVTGHVLG